MQVFKMFRNKFINFRTNARSRNVEMWKNRVWYLPYIEGNGMFCGFSRMTNTLQPNNNSKVWNSKATPDLEPRQWETISTKQGTWKPCVAEKIRCGTYFVENEKKGENLSSFWNKKVMPTFYWLWKEEGAHCKLNSLLKLAESFGVEEVATFKSHQIAFLNSYY